MNLLHPKGPVSRFTCAKAGNGFRDHFSIRAGLCQEVPSCPWVFVGLAPPDPDLWGFCGDTVAQEAVASECTRRTRHGCIAGPGEPRRAPRPAPASVSIHPGGRV